MKFSLLAVRKPICCFSSKTPAMVRKRWQFLTVIHPQHEYIGFFFFICNLSENMRIYTYTHITFNLDTFSIIHWIETNLRDVNVLHITSKLQKEGWMSKLQKEEGRGVLMFGVMAFVFPMNYYVWWALLSWKWMNICLQMGSSEWIPCFALLVHAAFPSPSRLSLSQLMSSWTFTFPVLSLLLRRADTTITEQKEKGENK